MKLVKIRKKKMQFFLLGLIFAIAVALFSVCMIFTVESNMFTKKYYKGDSTPDMTFVTASKNAAENVENWAKTNNTRNFYKSTAYPIGTMKVNSKNVDVSYAYIIPIGKKSDITWKIDNVDYNKKLTEPLKGEIWIANTLAEIKNIKAGDTVTITSANNKQKDLKVSAIVNDSNQPSTTLGINYLYCNKNEHFEAGDQGGYLAFNTDISSKNAFKSIFKDFNGAVAGFLIDKGTVIMAATVTPMIVGLIGLIACVLLIIVLIIIVKSNLWNHILLEYRNIGLYKSIGMTSSQINGIYIKSYMFISLVSSVIGVIISIPLSVYVCNKVFKYIGEYQFDDVSCLIIAVIFIIFNAIILISLKLTLRKVKNINPVKAINIGVSSSKEKFKKPLLEHTTNPFKMAINDIFRYKKRNLVNLVMFIVIFYMCTMFSGIYITIKDMDKNFDAVLGCPKSDLVIYTDTHRKNNAKEIIEYIKNNEYVNKYYVCDDHAALYNVSKKNLKYDVDVVAFIPTPFDKFNEDDYSIIEGHNPRNKNEIALSNLIMQRNKLTIGDYFELNVKGTNKKFLITGKFASMMGNRQSFRITTEGIEGEGGNSIYVKLKDLSDYDKLKKDIEQKYSYATVNNALPMMKDNIKQVQDIILPVTLILTIGMAAFAVINVINVVITINRESRKNYGIMKALGFRSNDISKRCIYRVMILSSLGALIGAALNKLIIKREMSFVMSGIECVTFTDGQSALICITVLLVILAVSVMCCRGIKKISTVELMEE